MESTEDVRAKFGRFRILVIGRANAGKTTLLQRVCNTTEEPKIFDREGKQIDVDAVKPSVNRGHHDINNELVFGSNPDFVFHDSCGFEAGGEEEFQKIKEFVSERASATKLKERIHVIWYCIPMDEHHRAITMNEERFFSECDTNNVPVVVVFTKFDALSAVAFGELSKKSGLPRSKIFDMIPEYAKKIFANANIWDRLRGLRYPPKNYVCLAAMNKDHADCAPLLESTTSALDEETLQMLLISTLRTNIQLSIKYAVERELTRSIEGVREGSALDIPTDSSLPVNIYHSSVRDYVSDPSNCSLPRVQDIPSPQSLLTRPSFPLMKKDIPESTVLADVPPVWKSGLTSFHAHVARLSMNMYPVQDLGPAVDESYEFASSVRPLMEYAEGDSVNLRGICGFLSSPDVNVQCVALQLLEHAAEWENTKFTQCMSETFGPVAELVLNSRDIQVHCAALDTLKLFLASPRAIDIVKSMIPRGVVDVVSTDLNSTEPLVQLASVELLGAASQSKEILVEFVAAVSLISRLLPSMLPATQVTALRVLEISAGSGTHELIKVVANTFHYLIQPLSSPEITVRIAALKVVEVSAGTKNHELACAVETILPWLR